MRFHSSHSRLSVIILALSAAALALAGCRDDVPSEDTYPVEGQEYLPYFVGQFEIIERHDDDIDLPDQIDLDDLDLYSGDFTDVVSLLYLEEWSDRDGGGLTIHLIDEPGDFFATLVVEYETESGPQEMIQFFSPVLLVVDDGAEMFRLQVPAVTATLRPAEPVMTALDDAERTVVADAREL